MAGYVTTSWDDGGPHDARLAEILASHGVAGTFYWTTGSDRFPLPNDGDIARTLETGIEIGSHTVTHPDMRAIDAHALAVEVTESKDVLEQITGRPVDSFCYPFGYFNAAACAAVQAAGYRLGRTTMGFRTDLGSDPYRMPVTIQMYPHGGRVHLTHAVKEANFSGLGSWLGRFGARSNLGDLVNRGLDHVASTGGVLHLWGHAWELEQFDLWDELKTVLRVIAERDDIEHATNGDLLTL